MATRALSSPAEIATKALTASPAKQARTNFPARRGRDFINTYSRSPRRGTSTGGGTLPSTITSTPKSQSRNVTAMKHGSIASGSKNVCTATAAARPRSGRGSSTSAAQVRDHSTPPQPPPPPAHPRNTWASLSATLRLPQLGLSKLCPACRGLLRVVGGGAVDVKATSAAPSVVIPGLTTLNEHA